MSSDEYRICLSSVGKPRSIVSISETDTVKDVKRMAQEQFDLHDITIKAGFPPRPLDINSERARTVFSRNERVQIEGASQKKSSAKKNGTKSKASAPAGRSSSQRSAARAATASFKDVIRAQEEAMKRESASRKKSPIRKRARPATNNKTSNATAQRRMARMPGRRLVDGAGVRPASVKQSRKPAQKFQSQDDVSFALLGALNHGGGGKVGQVLRGAMQNAVNNRYEASRAVVRVSAVQARKYTVQEMEGSLIVSYSKGMDGRGMYEEKVDLVPIEALMAVVTAIYSTPEEQGGKEMLRPANLAQLSPRVFWSLVKDNTGNSIEEALQQLCPTLDWSFLSSRKKTLSEKAKENLRQERSQGEEQDVQAGEEAVQAVEQAMEQLHEYDQSQMRERAARSAMRRQQGPTDTWSLETPNEVDHKELKECILQGSSEHPDSELVGGWVKSLIKSGIGNWRQLANADLQTVGNVVGLDPTQVESWMDHAQQQSVEEIIVELCDDLPDAVEVLRDEARSGTPRDLANWRSLSSMLYEEAPSLETMNVSVQQLTTWCERAEQILANHEWLHWYATPVVPS